MSGFQVDTNIDNDALTVGISAAEGLLALTSLKHWFQADADHVSLSGSDITSFADRVSGSAATLNPAGSTRRPALADATFGAYSSAKFTNSEGDSCSISGATVDMTSPFTIATLFKLNETKNNRAVWSKFTSSTVRSILVTGGGGANIIHQYGTGTLTAAINASDWNLVIASFDGTNNRLKANSGAAQSAVAAGSSGSALLNVGSLSGAADTWCLEGWISDLMHFDVDILDGSHATEYARLQDWASRFGLSI